jgi:proteic killer suppression protein
MDIIFKSTKLEKECNNEDLMVRRFGTARSKLLKKRLFELFAAATLQDLRNLPQARCHELKGNLKGYLSVDLDGLNRLLFEPANDPVPKKPDGGLDWTKVTVVRIVGMEDTHE